MATMPLIPSLFTSASLVCGMMASILAMNDALRLAQYQDVFKPFELSAWLIIVAIALDTLDGLIARRTKTESRFGVEYDSLADIVSFGMAPAILLYLAVLREYRYGWIFVSMYVMCGAIRLARFNARKGVGGPVRNFEGLPIPAGAGVLASYVLFSMWGNWHLDQKGVIFDRAMGWYLQHVSYYNQVVLPIATVLVSLLMVSSLEYPRLRLPHFRERVPVTAFVAGVSAFLFFLVTVPAVTFFVFGVTYMLWGAVTGLMHRARHHGPARKWEPAVSVAGGREA